MVLAEFLEALVRTAGKLLNTSKAGKQALKDGKLGEGFDKLVHTYVLPLADKDSKAEWRTQMASEEVAAVLANYRDALFLRFSEIVAGAKANPEQGKGMNKDKGPGKAKSAAPKANAKENKKAAAAGAELDGPSTVVKDFENAKLLIDLKIVVDNPVVGMEPLKYTVELSRMDVERGFIESQDKEEALLAIVTGNNKLLENANELDFEEYLK